MAGKYQPITIYKTANGEITNISYRETGETVTLAAGLAYIDGEYDGDDHYVSGGIAVERTEILADEETLFLDVSASNQTLIASLPVGTVVVCGRVRITFTATEALQVRVPKAGDYRIQVLPPQPQYKPFDINLVVSHAP